MNQAYLVSLRQNLREIEQLRYRISELEARMYLPSGQRFTLTPRGGASGSTMDDLIIAHDRLLNRYRAALASALAKQETLEGALQVLSHNERAVIRYWIFDHMNCEDIGRRMNYSPRQIYRIRSEAIRKLEDYDNG